MKVQPYHHAEPLPPLLPPRLPSDGYGNYSNGNGYTPQTVGYAGHSAHQHHDSHHPTMMHVMGKLTRERWKLLGLWLIVTGAIAAFVVKQYGKPTWRAEGTLLHSPEFNVTGGRRFYTPPSIQTVLMHLKSREVLGTLKQEYNLSESIDDLENKTNISITKQSELITVSFDWPVRDQVANMTSRLMALSIEHYNKLREKLVTEATTAATNAAESEEQKLLAMQQQYETALLQNHLHDLSNEISGQRADVLAAQNALTKEKTDKRSLEKQLETSLQNLSHLQEREANSPKSEVLTAEETSLLVQIKTAREQKRTRMQNKRKNEFNLEVKIKEYKALRELWMRGFETRQNLDKVEAEMKSLQIDLDLDKDLQKELADLELTEKKIFESARARSTMPVQQAQTRIDELQQLLSACPGKIHDAEQNLKEKEEHLQLMQNLKLKLTPLENQIKQKEKDLADAKQNKQQHDYLLTPNSADLRIHTAATSETMPRSTNAIKLGLGTFVISVALFLSYIFLVAMPRHSTSGEATAHRLGLPMLTHHPASSNGNRPPDNIAPVPAQIAKSALGKRNSQMESLANNITQNIHERGSIVLFTPVSRKMDVESLVGDLASQFAKLGDRVLVFDARPGNPIIPAWAGPNAPYIQDRVIQFLEGTNERTAGCFTPTRIASVDYSSADLTQHLNGVIATYRYRRLAEEMRERYTLVLMMAPDLEYLGDEGDSLSTMAEGVVVVLNEDANPTELEGYIHNLRSAEASVYGTVMMTT